MRQTGVAQPPGATRIWRWAGRSYRTLGSSSRVTQPTARSGQSMSKIAHRDPVLSRAGVGNSPKTEEGSGREPPRPNQGFRWMAKDGTQIGDDGRGGEEAPGATPSRPPHHVETSFGVSKPRHPSERTSGAAHPAPQLPNPSGRGFSLGLHIRPGFNPRPPSSGDPGLSARLCHDWSGQQYVRKSSDRCLP